MRVAVACGLLLTLGCDELGNPSTGVVFDDHGVQLRSQMRSAPAEAAEHLTAGLPQDALDYADDQAPIGGYVALVRVDITGLPEQPGSEFLLASARARGGSPRATSVLGSERNPIASAHWSGERPDTLASSSGEPSAGSSRPPG